MLKKEERLPRKSSTSTGNSPARSLKTRRNKKRDIKKTKQTNLNKILKIEHKSNLNNTPINLDKIQFHQLNTQKRSLSMNAVRDICHKDDLFVFLGQECSWYKNRIIGLDYKHKVICAPVDKPHAYIYYHKKLNILPVPTPVSYTHLTLPTIYSV